jgi:hypothetical protein
VAAKVNRAVAKVNKVVRMRPAAKVVTRKPADDKVGDNRVVKAAASKVANKVAVNQEAAREEGSGL